MRNYVIIEPENLNNCSLSFVLKTHLPFKRKNSKTLHPSYTLNFSKFNLYYPLIPTFLFITNNKTNNYKKDIEIKTYRL
jgi:predicted glycosyl hydrolase (DUF1957 family)